jgi:phage terminase large subunit GpA-like protein
MTKTLECWDHVVAALRPPPVEPFSVWIEREVRLPEGLSAEPGKVTLHPWQVEVANSIGDPEVERVSWLKAVRSGFTFLLACAVARHCEQMKRCKAEYKAYKKAGGEPRLARRY